MELKSYQREVINDLEQFLAIVQTAKDAGEAFCGFWKKHSKTPLVPAIGSAIEPYKNNVPNVPHVCVKVPTAGGKTFIACNAIKTIFNGFDYNHKKAVVWLVPSVTILEQTIRNLKNNAHPYRQKINSHFAHRVEVYDKLALLQGSSFNAASVQEQLSIFVLSFDSLRAKNKEERKVYQENSNLQSFGRFMGQEEEISVMRVIQSLNPVVIVDESHNAESELSVEMLRDLNPCFILDLTATPRKNSNIISFVDALWLKKENMVKLPVIVYNYHNKNDVIHSALELQRKLELLAIDEEKNGGRYIRPIVLFQAQPRNASDTVTFEKLKETLIGLNIPEERIKIKTAAINEIKDMDLTAKDCPVRFIITVNALKEGWDCPFAYILASLADKSSAVDVEQVLGRILRQPYIIRHNEMMLNLSYVLTASDRFIDTLDNIVKGLNRAGFSSKDFKAKNTVLETEWEPHDELVMEHTVKRDSDKMLDYAIAADDIKPPVEFNGDTYFVNDIESSANEQVDKDVDFIQKQEASGTGFLPLEIQSLVSVYKIKDALAELASQLVLPQFYIRKPTGEIFNEAEQLLNKEDLLQDFQLSKADATIIFDGVSSDLFKIDIDESTREHTPSFVRIDGRNKDVLISYLLHPDNRRGRVKNFASHINRLMGNLYPISETEVRKFLQKLLEGFTEEQYYDFLDHEYSYVAKIKEKIKSLCAAYAEKKFRDYVLTDKVFVKPSYEFPKEIIPGSTSKPIAGSLYEKEAKMDNGFEERVINEIAGLTNIIFWTRNMERRQFKINGFLNHYPDFIIHTKRGKTILLETKGDDRDNSGSAARLELGKAWEKAAGADFKYMMVFDKTQMAGAHRLDEFLKLLREL